MKSKKKRAKQKASQEAWSTFRKDLLMKTGYTKLKAKHGSSLKPDFPDYKTESNYSLSDTIGNGLKTKSGANHADARKFEIYEGHKQGPMLMVPSDGREFSGGKKPT